MRSGTEIAKTREMHYDKNIQLNGKVYANGSWKDAGDSVMRMTKHRFSFAYNYKITINIAKKCHIIGVWIGSGIQQYTNTPLKNSSTSNFSA